MKPPTIVLDKKCKNCKPRRIPVFPVWTGKSKYWHRDKKEKRMRELCCELNGKAGEK